MSEDQHNYLLDAIDALTLPTKVRFLQVDDDGNSAVSIQDHESLIERLRDAIAGGIGSHAGAGSTEPRLPFDAGALALYDRIEGKIAEWFVDMFHKPIGILPEVNLREWYTEYAYFRRPESGADTGVLDWMEAEVTRQVSSWVRSITNHFDPPKRMEITTTILVPAVHPRTGIRLYTKDGELRTRQSVIPAACPLCDQRNAWDPNTGDQITALVIEYRQSQEDDAINAGIARCRSCEHEWKGDRGLRELRMEIDQWEDRFAAQTDAAADQKS